MTCTNDMNAAKPLPALRVTLPIPPSLNNRMFVKNNRMILSEKYRTWKKLAVLSIMDQRKETHPMSAGIEKFKSYEVDIHICFGDRRSRDIDNYIKPGLDVLTEALVWKDDSLADIVRIERSRNGTRVDTYDINVFPITEDPPF